MSRPVPSAPSPESPLPPAADLETSSDDYARRFAGAVGGWFLGLQASTTLALLAPFPRARVLDVGGGHGQLTAPLLGAGHEVTVLGSDPRCAARLRPWLDSGQVAFAAGDLARLPWDDRAFDAVLAFRLLPHVPDWRALVRELSRVARRAVIVDYPTRRSVNAASFLLFALKRRVEGDTRPFTVFRDREVREAFASSGLDVTAREPQFVLPMAAHRALGIAAVSRLLEGGLDAVGLRRLAGSPVILRAERRG